MSRRIILIWAYRLEMLNSVCKLQQLGLVLIDGLVGWPKCMNTDGDTGHTRTYTPIHTCTD